MSTKIVPQGLGGWVAFESSLDPGTKVRDLHVAIQRCADAGMSWIAPRAGAGGTADGAFDDASIEAYLAAGLVVMPWVFPYVGTERKVTAIFRRWFVAGAHGAIINAEFEYQPATAAAARALVASIRTAWAEAQSERLQRGLEVVADEPWIAHAPPDYLGAGVGHPLSDELVALDEECDAILPQIYAWEHDDKGHAYHLERVMAGYARRGLFADKVWPVGCTYRPKARGFDTAGKPRPTPVMENEQERIANDLVAFLEHPIVAACPAPSLYTLDAITWINGPGDRVMAALRAHRDPQSPPPDSQADTWPGTPTAKSSQRLAAVDAPIFDGPATPIRATEGEHTVPLAEIDFDDGEVTALEAAFGRWLRGEAAPNEVEQTIASPLRDYSDVALAALGEVAGWSIDPRRLEDGLRWLADVALERVGVPAPVVTDGLAQLCLGLAARERPWLATWHDQVLARAADTVQPAWLAGGGRVARGQASVCAPELRIALASRGAASSTDTDGNALLEGLLRGELPEDAFHAQVLLVALAWTRRAAPIVLPGQATPETVARLLAEAPRALQQWPWEDKPKTKNSRAAK